MSPVDRRRVPAAHTLAEDAGGMAFRPADPAGGAPPRRASASFGLSIRCRCSRARRTFVEPPSRALRACTSPASPPAAWPRRPRSARARQPLRVKIADRPGRRTIGLPPSPARRFLAGVNFGALHAPRWLEAALADRLPRVHPPPNADQCRDGPPVVPVQGRRPVENGRRWDANRREHAGPAITSARPTPWPTFEKRFLKKKPPSEIADNNSYEQWLE